MKNQIESSTVSVEVNAVQGRLIEFRPNTQEFKVFLDEETNDTVRLLNRIRQEAPPEVVIMAVSLVRGLQVGINYSKKYAPHLTWEIETKLNRLLAQTCGTYLTE